MAESFLSERNCPEDLKSLILECIELHHTGGSERSLESILLRDADILDFLGVMGIMRDVSKNPRNLRKAYRDVQRRRDKLPALLCLEKAQAIAAERIERMNGTLAAFEEESFECF